MDLKFRVMKDLIKIEEIQNIEILENEYDFEKASLLDRKLRLMVKERPEFKSIRKKSNLWFLLSCLFLGI